MRAGDGWNDRWQVAGGCGWQWRPAGFGIRSFKVGGGGLWPVGIDGWTTVVAGCGETGGNGAAGRVVGESD